MKTTKTIILQTGKVKGQAGWLINSTDGFSISDRLNTANPIKAKAHVDYLLAKGYLMKAYAHTRWQALKECAADWEAYAK